MQYFACSIFFDSHVLDGSREVSTRKAIFVSFHRKRLRRNACHSEKTTGTLKLKSRVSRCSSIHNNWKKLRSWEVLVYDRKFTVFWYWKSHRFQLSNFHTQYFFRIFWLLIQAKSKSSNQNLHKLLVFLKNVSWDSSWNISENPKRWTEVKLE